MLIYSDLHLKPESAQTCFQVLQKVYDLAASLGEDVVFLGDFWHVRYAVPVELLNWVDRFLEIRSKTTLSIMIAGNHDQIDVKGQNALEVFERPGVVIITEPTETGRGLWLPYRKEAAQLVPFVEASKARRAFVHHGLVGAMMNSHVVAGENDGLPPSWFAKFETVFFGHWHRHQQVGNCVYIGSPWQTRSDEAGQQKGVVHLDEKSGAWKFIPIEVGTRFIRATSVTDVMDARPGDVVKLAHGVPKDFIDDLVSKGIEVRVDPPKVETSTRFGLDGNATLRDYALRYVEKEYGHLDRAMLMAIFDEVVSS